MAISACDLFKIGIGPSSSHTVGPMKAAHRFVLRLAEDGVLGDVVRVHADLFGSLGATGKGHGSDKAVILGLAGHEPDTVDVDAVPALLQHIRDTECVDLLGRHPVSFIERDHLCSTAGSRCLLVGTFVMSTPSSSTRDGHHQLFGASV